MIPALFFCSLLSYFKGRDVDLLFGLDMLKAHQACIDLEKNVLRIQGREVTFLAEHQLPSKARDMDNEEAPASSSTPSKPSTSTSGGHSFPGGGNTIGSAPAASQTTSHSTSRHSEANIKAIMDLGASREVAIRSLDAADGNVDVAASLLF
ncbi:hypothetical protein C8J56DRAFT_565085 [Mycena floridula]|nr:hypothetical protein C8J56DRAFT_565085 [Mycena floridula]